MQLLPWVKTWKAPCVCVCVCTATSEHECVSKVYSESSSEPVYFPQINSLTAWTLWVFSLRYALLVSVLKLRLQALSFTLKLLQHFNQSVAIIFVFYILCMLVIFIFHFPHSWFVIQRWTSKNLLDDDFFYSLWCDLNTMFWCQI